MPRRYPRLFQSALLACCLLCFLPTSADGQLIVEREFIGGAAPAVTLAPAGSQNQLKVDDSFGETIIGYAEGDIIITVGFQQTDTSDEDGDNIGHATTPPPVRRPAEQLSVTAFPNPTIERLSVDLGVHSEKFVELSLIDIYGRTVRNRKINDQTLVTFSNLNELPNADYFLMGLDTEGKLHKLSTVMIITY